MRIKIPLVVLIVSVGFSASTFAMKIAGITMPDSFKAGNSSLVLNGAGIRTKLMLDIYAGGLYLQSKSSDGAAIINANEPMMIRLHIVSKLISPKDFEVNTREGFSRSTGGNIAPIKNQIEQFIAIFKEGISKNDVYDIMYDPAKGTCVYKNGTFKAASSGLEFKKALFGIWFGPTTMNPALRKGMLVSN